MIRILLAWSALAVTVLAADPGAVSFRKAENLARSKQYDLAMVKAEEAIAQIEKAAASGEQIGWHGMNAFRFSSQLAREHLLDYNKSLMFCNKMLRHADSDYWKCPARLEMALTYRAMGDFKKAQQQYDLIAASDARQKSSMLLPQAEMVFFDLKEEKKGKSLLVAALKDENVSGRERFNSIRKCAADAMLRGRRDEAIEWYSLTDKIPFEKQDERAKFLTQTWYEMGRIEESRGRTSQAKALYRRAMQLEDGEMRLRARARDALESIQYFE